MNNIDHIISSVAGESLDYKKYKNNLSGIFNRGGKIIGSAKVPYCKVDTSNNKKYQIRAITTDKGHVAKLAADIGANGIEIIPTVEWNDTTGVFEILSGHHRTLAVHKVNLRSLNCVGYAPFQMTLSENCFYKKKIIIDPLKAPPKPMLLFF